MFLVTFLMVIFSSCTPPATAKKATGEIDGTKIYMSYCNSCHGAKGDRGLSNAADLSSSTLKNDQIRKVILYGTGNGMSAYKSVIKEEEEIVALVKHVKSLQQ